MYSKVNKNIFTIQYDEQSNFIGPLKSFSTRGNQEDDEVDATVDLLVNVPELPKNQTQVSIYPHWFDISSGGVGLTALSDGKITIWDIENGKCS